MAHAVLTCGRDAPPVPSVGAGIRANVGTSPPSPERRDAFRDPFTFHAVLGHTAVPYAAQR